MNTHAMALLAAKATLGATLALGLLLTPHATAHAEPTTVDVSDIPDIANVAQCALEDGSDVPAALLPCIWGNESSAWLTYAGYSLLIVDATDGNVSDMDLGA